ncbi:MAG: patatin-like phospholipase family protein [Bacillota bacterium]
MKYGCRVECENNAKLERKRGIGLALGSGAARGLAHIGVLKVLEREGINIRAITGASIGALIGGLYAAGMSVAEMERHALDVTKRSVLAWIDPILPRQGLIVGRKIQDMLRSFIGDIEFPGLRIPLAIVATDILTGEEVVFSREGNVVDAIRASISIPAIFVPVRLGDRLLVDGGVVNSVPVDHIRSLDKSAAPVAVSVTPKLELKHIEDPTAVDIILNTLDIMQHRLFQTTAAQAKVVIEPDVSFASGIEFWEARELIARGEQAAFEAIPRIRKAISKLSW